MKNIILLISVMVVGCATLTPEEQKVVGEYEYYRHRAGGVYSYRGIFLYNGIVEWYDGDGKVGGLYNVKRDVPQFKWSIVKKEIHSIQTGGRGLIGQIKVYRINSDKSITHIATIRNGKRTDHPKEQQPTYKKIK